MKSKTLIIAATILLAVIFPMQELLAQRGGFGGRGKAANCPNPDARKQFREYCQNEMLPKLEELKKELDNRLSKTDLDNLNQLRKRAAELREEAMKKRTEKPRPNREKKPNYEERQKFRAEMEQHRQKMQEIFDEVDKIIKNNNWILQDIEPKLEKIQPERPNFKDKKQPRPDAPNPDFGPMQDRMRLHRGFDIERFMLWDGSNFIEKAERLRPDANLNTVTNYPNPFSSQTTIAVNSDKEQNARINLYDINGEFVAEIFKGKLNKGKNEITFSASTVKNFKPGTYLYIVSLDDGKKLEGKMIYSK
ncbi:MAG TPA: T9SS type A sorting domain-containing protein [Candidatus Kapabacteria bacterium]|nr:T9SS type A sorting domain-containing protein [Candidatus Kapabacteria bacterium]HPU22728.1 T9SS type A sorting domain-containing protein [Candidatus Kapabacteria bacterium]